MKKILVAYDGTPGAESALNDMIRGGFPDRVEARVLTVADLWMPRPPAEGEIADQRVYLAAREKGKAAVEKADQVAAEGAKLLSGHFTNWQISAGALADSPAWGIIGEAKRWEADLIAIGSHGRNPLERFFLGSVSHKVAAEAPCSVRVVRTKTNHSRHGARLMIAVDGSSDGDRAIQEVLRRQWGSEAVAHLVTVNEGDRINQNSVQSLLERAPAEFAAKQVRVEVHTLEGDTKNALLRHAEKMEADCIFVGARGLQHGNRLYLGTVASAICSRAHCTVEVIRPRPVH